ncbi:UNKNOWN [Stylonychia lemnae]|uniref:TLDc domain-containing protein n=1 Tax=Stylonychia lemnae TaxID=5949 RepID=A0A078AI39_STYLE|nr:UNKNOWN [Stylonychia lemnae]|eukprot:CDW81182.1 UNKNOWN [Stylonychia lemnae]
MDLLKIFLRIPQAIILLTALQITIHPPTPHKIHQQITVEAQMEKIAVPQIIMLLQIPLIPFLYHCSMIVLFQTLLLQTLATRDGFNNTIFNQSCANRGPSLIIVKSNRGFVFGGYNPLSWSSDYYTKGQEAAYIFSVDNNAVLRPQQNQSAIFIAMLTYNLSPQFGLQDILVDFDTPTFQYSFLGNSYYLPQGFSKDSDQARSFLAGERYYSLVEVETYLLN